MSFFAQMQFWEDIRKNALLGTERIPFSEEVLPAELRQYFQNEDMPEQELVFLKALTLASVYQKSGQGCTAIDPPAFELCPPESKPYCPTAAVEIWHKIKNLQPMQHHLIALFLLKLSRRQWLMLPDEIVDLLTLGSSKKGAQLIDLIADVVGERGKWLLALHPDWKSMLVTDNEYLFKNGMPSEKVAALKRIRRSDPDRGRILLMDVWEKTPAKERAGLLKALAVNFSESDIPFLRSQKQFFTKVENMPLLQILQPRKQIEQNFINSRPFFYGLTTEDLPIHFDWSPGFSHFVLRQLLTADTGYIATFIKKFLTMASYLDPSIDLAKIPRSNDNPLSVKAWQTYSADINPILECKRAIAYL